MKQNVLEGFASDWPPAAAVEPSSAGPPVPPMTPVEARNPAGPRRLVVARGFRVESGAVVFVALVGCVAAFAPGTWSTIEPDWTYA